MLEANKSRNTTKKYLHLILATQKLIFKTDANNESTLLENLEQGVFNHILQQKPKWLTKNKTINDNDLVPVKSNDFPMIKWPLARVLSIDNGPDELTRVIILK